jgi:SAM-dependent methyltransferase
MSEPKIHYWPEGKKLVFIKKEATSDFWDQQYQTELEPQGKLKLTRARGSRYWHSILQKYLPDKNALILEGGCGDGHLVDAMQYWGYKAVGVDFAERTIATTRKIAPELDLNIGDVRKLDYEDCSFDGYWSLGVIEHFWEGYSSILKEMYRVLKPGGFLAFFSLHFLVFPQLIG